MMQARARGALGFFGGIGAFLEGAAFIVGTPGVWGYALVPVLVALVLTTGLAALGLAAIVHLAHNVVGPDPSAPMTALAWLIELVLGLLVILAAVLIAFALAQPLS